MAKAEDAKSRKQAMASVIATLPERQRQVLKLLMQGKSEKEIALLFGVSQQAISKLKFKLQKKFETFLR